MDFLTAPWPWYVSGPIIGISVPLLLLIGDKRLGVSSTLRHICAATLPGKIPLFQYNWKKEMWSLFFVTGIVLGGFIGGALLANPQPVNISDETRQYLIGMGITDFHGYLPAHLFSKEGLFTMKGFLLMIAGGFLVGFGTRYARGCTSGHGILGLSALQWPSLVATASFFAGGILFSYLVLPWILSL
jgi:hypothetical protein